MKLKRYIRMNLRDSFTGNTLAEYALPIALIVISSGAIMAFLATNNAIPNYLASASGGSVSGSGIKAPAPGEGVGGSLGTGGQGGAGSNATILGGGGPGFFFSGPAYNGAGAETIGGDGSGKGLSLPTPPPGHKQGGKLPPGDSLHYVPTVKDSVATGHQMEASRAAAQALVSTKYADSLRVQVAAIEDPRGVAGAGGDTAFQYGNIQRDVQISTAADGGPLSSISNAVQQEEETLNGASSQAIQSWSTTLDQAHNNDGPDANEYGTGTLNPDEYKKFLEEQYAILQGEASAHCIAAGLPCE